MKIGYWTIQSDLDKAFRGLGCETAALDWHGSDWRREFRQADCDAYVWFPHALHEEWHKLADRAVYIEEYLGKAAFPGPRTAYLFQNKLRQQAVFEDFSVPSPRTWIARHPKEKDAILKQAGFPLAAKDIFGYDGEGVAKLEDTEELDNYIREQNIFLKDNYPPQHYLYLQEVINAKAEYRVISVGGRVIAAHERRSPAFIKNLAQGAEISWKVPDRVIDFVNEQDGKLGLDCGGWDVLNDQNDKLYVLEVNPIFGTKALEQKGTSLAPYIAEYVVGMLK